MGEQTTEIFAKLILNLNRLVDEGAPGDCYKCPRIGSLMSSALEPLKPTCALASFAAMASKYGFRGNRSRSCPCSLSVRVKLLRERNCTAVFGRPTPL